MRDSSPVDGDSTQRRLRRLRQVFAWLTILVLLNAITATVVCGFDVLRHGWYAASGSDDVVVCRLRLVALGLFLSVGLGIVPLALCWVVFFAREMRRRNEWRGILAMPVELGLATAVMITLIVPILITCRYELVLDDQGVRHTQGMGTFSMAWQDMTSADVYEELGTSWARLGQVRSGVLRVSRGRNVHKVELSGYAEEDVERIRAFVERHKPRR
ncbi:MAG: hypothetical protein HYY16_11220 [Planctomycetes bacterium]|nr:hypothetical protein [Planctomycetota bacterium]